MVDFSGGHPSTEAAAKVVAALDDELGGHGVEFHPGVEYRHIMVAPASWAEASCTPPHDLSDQPVVLPEGPAGPDLRRLMEASRPIVERFGLAANQIWLWGQGVRPDHAHLRLPVRARRRAQQRRRPRAGPRGAHRRRGGRRRGHDRRATTPTTAPSANVRSMPSADGADLFLIHIEATDEAGHAGDVHEKIAALESWDRDVLGALMPGLDRLGPWRLLMVPDHATPLRLKTHTSDPVPYLLVDSQDRRARRHLHRGRRGRRADRRRPRAHGPAHRALTCAHAGGDGRVEDRLPTDRPHVGREPRPRCRSGDRGGRSAASVIDGVFGVDAAGLLVDHVRPSWDRSRAPVARLRARRCSRSP